MKRLIRGYYLIALAVALTTLAAMYIEYRSFSGAITEGALLNSQLESRLIASELGSRLSRKGQVVADAASFIAQGPDEATLRLYLQRLHKDNPIFTNLYFAHEDGRIISAVDWVTPPGFELKSRPWYSRAIEEKGLVFTEAFPSIIGNRLLVTVAMVVYDGSGQLQGVMGGNVDVQSILSIVKQNYTSETRYAFLIDGQGSVLAHPAMGESVTPVPLEQVSESLAALLRSGQGYTEASEIDGKLGHVSMSPVAGTRWQAGSFISMEEHVDSQTLILNVFVLVLLSSAVVLVLLFLIQRRYLIRPIIALDRDIRGISLETTRDYRLPYPEKDVFKTIRDAVNGVLETTHKFFDSMEQSQKALQASESINRAIIDALPDVVFRLNRQGVFLDCQSMEGANLLMSPDDFVGRQMQAVLPLSAAERALEAIAAALDGQGLQTFEYTQEVAGALNYFEMRVTPSRADEVVAVARNITEKKLTDLHITYLSYHDQLTGLYNRRYFEEEFRRLDTPRNLPFSLAMADVNGLKLTNDAFGHTAGDALLVRVAEIISRECRADDIVARIGGDEFVMLFPKTSEQEVKGIIHRIQQAIAQVETERIILSVSIGWSTKTEASADLEEALAHAEENMYRKKLVESQSMRNETIQVILKTLGEKNAWEEDHSVRVGKLCREIGQALGLEREALGELETAGLMHDIGKIAVSDTVLTKTAPLTELEQEEMRKHPETGYQILKSADAYTSLAEVVLSHHEHWDGSGYPRGLKGQEIPYYSRIIAVADAFETLMRPRRGREALDVDGALAAVQGCAGVQFDPEVVAAAMAALQKD